VASFSIALQKRPHIVCTPVTTRLWTLTNKHQFNNDYYQCHEYLYTYDWLQWTTGHHRDVYSEI